jgi:hypothetical protein
MIANDPSIMMVEKMAYSSHAATLPPILPTSEPVTTLILPFRQKPVSGLPMPKKKDVVEQKSMATKVAKMAKQGSRKLC